MIFLKTLYYLQNKIDEYVDRFTYIHNADLVKAKIEFLVQCTGKTLVLKDTIFQFVHQTGFMPNREQSMNFLFCYFEDLCFELLQNAIILQISKTPNSSKFNIKIICLVSLNNLDNVPIHDGKSFP